MTHKCSRETTSMYGTSHTLPLPLFFQRASLQLSRATPSPLHNQSVLPLLKELGGHLSAFAQKGTDSPETPL